MNLIRQFLAVVETKEHRIVLTLVLLVILSGIVYSIYLGDKLRFYDEFDYYNLAKTLALKQRYSLYGDLTAARPPGYPFFLSIFISLGASLSFLRILNFLALGFSIYLLYLLIKNLSSEFAGLISAILVLCYPVLFYASSLLIAQPIGAFLFLLILFILLRGKTLSVKSSILTGILFGYLILTIPYFIFSLVIIVLWILFSNSEGKVKTAVIVSIMAFLVISFWSVRNYAIFRSFVFVSTNSGKNLLIGNSENTNPNEGAYEEKISRYIPNSVDLNEAERDAYYRAKAIEFILKNKIEAFKLYLLKLLNYFNYRNELHGNVEDLTKKYKDIIMLVTYGPLLLVFMFRLVFLKKYNLSRSELLLIILYLSNAFFLAIFHTRIRFRLPFDFLLIGVVAMFIANQRVFKWKINCGKQSGRKAN